MFLLLTFVFLLCHRKIKTNQIEVIEKGEMGYWVY